LARTSGIWSTTAPSGDEHLILNRTPYIVKSWILLFTAALLEVGWAIGLKYTHGFTRLWPSVATIATMAASMYLLALAARTLPIGTAYAVWTGIGAVGTALLGIVVLKEPASAARVACIALIVAGVIGLKVFGGRPAGG
jgi:quaternary ammonium compound-resistance protein SugE